MTIKYSDNIRQWNGHEALVQQATTELEKILQRSGGQVSAEWDRRQVERGRPLFVLRLSDSAGEVSADFAPDQLHSPRRVRLQLLELWGDLLQIRSHKQLQKLTEASQTGE